MDKEITQQQTPEAKEPIVLFIMLPTPLLKNHDHVDFPSNKDEIYCHVYLTDSESRDSADGKFYVIRACDVMKCIEDGDYGHFHRIECDTAFIVLATEAASYEVKSRDAEHRYANRGIKVIESFRPGEANKDHLSDLQEAFDSFEPGPFEDEADDD